MSIQFDLQAVSVHFGAREALKAVDLQIAQGDRLALIGANGSGKTDRAGRDQHPRRQAVPE